MDLQKLHFATIVVRILLAVVIGGIVGLERGVKSQAAGFRTYILVCLGSAIVMMTNQYITDLYGTGDPSRMASQVISGIGFLGAGTILVTDANRIKGLTTAAGLWTAAAIGLAIGIGFYEGAFAGAVALIVIMTIFQKVKRRIQNISRMMEVLIVVSSLEAYHRVLLCCSSNDVDIIETRSGMGDVDSATFFNQDTQREKTELSCILSVRLTEGYEHEEFLEELAELPGVRFVEELN